MVYTTSTYYETGKTILELRYFVWERRKRKYFIDLVEQSEIIYLKGNQQIDRGMYYVDVSPLKDNNKKSFYVNVYKFLSNKEATNRSFFYFDLFHSIHIPNF